MSREKEVQDMKRKFSSETDKLKHLSDEEFAAYWETHDAARILETGEQETLESGRVDKRCPACGSSRMRPRMIDLPILSGKVVLKRVKTLYCVECSKSSIEQVGVEEAFNELNSLVSHIDKEKFIQVLKDALISYDERWAEKENERKVISVYLPTRAGEPNKAQISIKVSDPLYPKIRFLTSEEIRKLLGVEYYEDLQEKAEEDRRTVSQYMRIALAEKFLDIPTKNERLGGYEEP